MIYIIGGKGLTGSAIVRYLKTNFIEYEIIQKENIDKYIGKSCDILIYANGNSKKYLATQDPYFDFTASVQTVAFYIHNINFKKFIHLSTIDVYSDTSNNILTKENQIIDCSKLSNYGFHKYLAENYIKKFTKDFIILRLPALVGEGLEKNPIYDFMHKDKKILINPNSKLNVIHTDFIAQSVFKLLDKNISNETFNLCSRNSIQIKNIKDIIGFDSMYQNDVNKYTQIYNINTEKISKYMDLSTSEESILKYFKQLKEENEK